VEPEETAVDRQWPDKRVSAATNQHATCHIAPSLRIHMSHSSLLKAARPE
jgi:CBS-domain-containing membrane protein